MKKAFKELDKLERDSLVTRLQQKDQEKTMQKSMGSIVENQELTGGALSFQELKEMVPDLRKTSRQAYLKHRDEQVMDLYKRNLDEEKRVFGASQDMLTADEKRIAELKEMLYGLAMQFKQKKQNDKMYHFPD